MTETTTKPWLVTVCFLFGADPIGGKRAVDEMQREVRRVAEHLGLTVSGASTKWSPMPDHEEPKEDDR